MEKSCLNLVADHSQPTLECQHRVAITDRDPSITLAH